MGEPARACSCGWLVDGCRCSRSAAGGRSQWSATDDFGAFLFRLFCLLALPLEQVKASGKALTHRDLATGAYLTELEVGNGLVCVVFPSHRACVRRARRAPRAHRVHVARVDVHGRAPCHLPPPHPTRARVLGPRMPVVRCSILVGGKHSFGSNAMSLYCQILHKDRQRQSGRQAIVSCCLLVPSLRSPSHCARVAPASRFSDLLNRL